MRKQWAVLGRTLAAAALDPLGDVLYFSDIPGDVRRRRTEDGGVSEVDGIGGGDDGGVADGMKADSEGKRRVRR